MTIKKPLVSIIITTKNESKNIGYLLKSFTKQNYSNFEIIVVDNYSTDDTVNIAQRFTNKIYLQGPERSNQRNFGAQKAKGKYLLFLDADMELTFDIILECVSTINKQKAAAIIIPEDVKGNTFYQRVKRLEKRMYWKEPDIEAARFFKKSVFKKINGYNESLIAGEDWDISLRAKKIGKIVRINSILYHQSNSFIKNLKSKVYYSRHILKYARVYPDIFTKQSGINRSNILLKNAKYLTEQPIEYIGLLISKMIEFITYQLMSLLNKL